jgi:L-rhamnose-H+ transport protein
MGLDSAVVAGILLVGLAGIATGSIVWPMKIIRQLQFEHYWFVGMLIGLVIIPWTVVFVCVDEPFSVYKEVGMKPLLTANLLSTGWGIANVLAGLCVLRIGAALTGAILTSLGLSVGSMMAMILKGTGMFGEAPDIASKVGLTIVLAVLVILVGVVFLTLAGFGREKALKDADEETRRKQASGRFLTGLLLAAIAGVLSCCIALSFVYSQGPIVAAMTARGVGQVVANISVWAGGLLGGALVNLLYPAYLMTRNRSWKMLTRHYGELCLGALIGIQFITGIIMMGRGMLYLGALGASVGFGIQQAMQIMGGQGVGFISGEWRSVTGKPRHQMYAAIAILLIGVVILVLVKVMEQS